MKTNVYPREGAPSLILPAVPEMTVRIDLDGQVFQASVLRNKDYYPLVELTILPQQLDRLLRRLIIDRRTIIASRTGGSWESVPTLDRGLLIRFKKSKAEVVTEIKKDETDRLINYLCSALLTR